PDDYGEVSLAMLLMFTANVAANVGLGQYMVSKPKADPREVFHGVFYYHVIGVVCIGLAFVFQGPVAELITAPTMGRFLPGLVLVTFIERFVTILDRVQLRDM